MERLGTWKVILGLAAGLVGCGIAFASWDHSVAKMSDVDQVKKAMQLDLSTAQASTTAQLGALQVQSTETRERVIRVEAGLAGMADDVRFLREQIIEIAKATGAKAVKDP